MNLQFFAEGDGTGAGDNGGDGAGAGAGTGGDHGDGNEPPKTFDDFLALGGNQAEFDRRLQKSIATAIENAQQKWT
ncbi:MAG: phage capsid protein, partial [Lachnospiraceae bacterium]